MCQEEEKLLYIPEGIANAHLILRENTRVLYQLGSQYMPEYDAGVRWDSLGIDFGAVTPIITEKDAALPPFSEIDSPFVFEGNC